MFHHIVKVVVLISLCAAMGCGASGNADTPKPKETPAAVQPPPATQLAQAPVPTENPTPSLQPTAGQSTGAPKLVCDEPVFDFGIQDDSGSVKHSYTIRNTGDGDLRIRDIRTSCGCTAAAMEKQVLAPGESDVIVVNFNLKGRQGKQVKSITINSNDKENPAFKLTLKGTIISPIMMMPNRISFGQVPTGEEHVKEVRVYTERDDIEFSITEIKSSNPEILTEYKNVRPGKEYLLFIKTSENAPAGVLDAQLTILTDNKERPKLNLIIYANMMGPVRYMPNRIILRQKDDLAIRATRQIRVLSGKVENFKILEVITPDDEIVVTITERAPNDYLIMLANMPVTGSLDNKEVVIKLDTEEGSEIRIPISGGKAPVRSRTAVPVVPARK